MKGCEIWTLEDWILAEDPFNILESLLAPTALLDPDFQETQGHCSCGKIQHKALVKLSKTQKGTQPLLVLRSLYSIMACTLSCCRLMTAPPKICPSYLASCLARNTSWAGWSGPAPRSHNMLQCRPSRQQKRSQPLPAVGPGVTGRYPLHAKKHHFKLVQSLWRPECGHWSCCPRQAYLPVPFAEIQRADEPRLIQSLDQVLLVRHWGSHQSDSGHSPIYKSMQNLLW